MVAVVPTLTQLGDKHNTDKATRGHRYTDFYPYHLERFRYTATKILEIGVDYGYSMLMWQDYFENATIYGADNDLAKNRAVGERIITLAADQSSQASLMSLAGFGPFDVIIDDGSHRAPDQILTFETLFPAVKPGGVYICEDVQAEFYGWGCPVGAHPVLDRFYRAAVDIQCGGKGDHAVFTDAESVGLSWWEREVEFVDFRRYCVFIGRRKQEDT